MSTPRIIYITSIFTAFLIGTIVNKYDRKLNTIVLLLGLGVVTELVVEINKYINITTEQFIYNIYIPLEYLIYSLFFFSINKSKIIKTAILSSIPIFTILVLLLSEYRNIKIANLSANIYNISSVITVIWCVWTLFVIEPIKNIKFTKHPLFWICTGLIIFHSGIIPFNLMHNYIKDTDYVLFDWLSKFFQKGLNVWLYTTYSIGFICSHRMKK